MENRNPASLIAMWSTLIFCSMFSLACICVFAFLFILLVNSLLSLPPTVFIYKGYYFTFGAGITMGALMVDGATVTILKRPSSDRAAALIGRFAISGLVIMFLLPQLIHYPAAEYLEKKGYDSCEQLSTQWRFVRTIAYTKHGYCVERNDEAPGTDK